MCQKWLDAEERVQKAKKTVSEHRAKQAADNVSKLEAVKDKVEALKNNDEYKAATAAVKKCHEDNKEKALEGDAKTECVAKLKELKELKKNTHGDDVTDKAKCFCWSKQRLRFKIKQAVACSATPEEASEDINDLLEARFVEHCAENEEHKLCTGKARERLNEFIAKIEERTKDEDVPEDEEETDKAIKCREDVKVVVDVADKESEEKVGDEDDANLKRQANGEMVEFLGETSEFDVEDVKVVEEDTIDPLEVEILFDEDTTDFITEGDNKVDPIEENSASTFIASGIMAFTIFASLL